MAVEWELVKGYLKIVIDPSVNSYKLQFYNTTTAAWEDVLEYNPATKETVLAPAFRDGVKLSLGTDSDYSLYYDATADAFRLRDEVNAVDILEISRNGVITVIKNLADDLELGFGTDNDFTVRYDSTNDDLRIKDTVGGTEYRIPKAQNRDLGQFSKYRYASEPTGVTIGIAGSPATIVSLAVTNADFMNLMPLKVTATPSGLGSAEAATFDVDAVLDDGSVVTLATITTAAASTATETFLITDFDFSLIPDGRRITELRLTAESSATSTTATATGDISAIEHD
jgi:hypothetical protein